MFNVGEIVEVNVCLGESAYGISARNFYKVCSNRIGVIRQVYPNGNFEVLLPTFDRTWNFPPEVIKKIKEV